MRCRVLAAHGPIELLVVGSNIGAVYDSSSGTVYPANTIEAILARGYWTGLTERRYRDVDVPGIERIQTLLANQAKANL